MSAFFDRYARTVKAWSRDQRAPVSGGSRSLTYLLWGLVGLAFLTCIAAIGFLVSRADHDANVIAGTAVLGALDRDRSRVSNETYINACWDDAADHVYHAIDARWAQSQWSGPIAYSFVIDASGRTLFSHLPDGSAPALSTMIDARTLSELLKRVPATEKLVRARRDATTLVARFGGQPALIGFSPIVREKGATSLDRRSYRIFVDVLPLSHEVLSEWSKGFGFSDLRWSTTGMKAGDEASIDVKDWRGLPMGMITWQRLRPAVLALRAILPVILGCAMLFLVIATFVVRRVIALNRHLAVETRLADEAARDQQIARQAAEVALCEAEAARHASEEQTKQRIAGETRHRAEMAAASNVVADQLQATVAPLIADLRMSANDLDASADHTLATIVDQQRQAETAHSVSIQASAATSALLESLRSFAENVDVVAAEAGRSARTTIQAASHSAAAQAANETLMRSVGSIEQSATRIAVLSKATNLLALNATIEAARAGEMGRGFSVVAQEMKNFSHQTAGTTHEIADRIQDISTATLSAVKINEALRNALDQLASSAVHTVETASRQHKANAEIEGMIGAIRTSTATTRDIFGSLTETFDETASVAHRTRTIGAEMRIRTETLQRECDRVVAMLRIPPDGHADEVPRLATG